MQGLHSTVEIARIAENLSGGNNLYIYITWYRALGRAWHCAGKSI